MSEVQSLLEQVRDRWRHVSTDEQRVMVARLEASLADLPENPENADTREEIESLVNEIENSHEAGHQTVAPPPVLGMGIGMGAIPARFGAE